MSQDCVDALCRRRFRSPESGNEHDRFAVSGGVGAKLNVVCSAIDPPNTYRRTAAARLPRGYGLRSNTA